MRNRRRNVPLVRNSAAASSARQRSTRVAVGFPHQQRERVVLDLQLECAESTVYVA